MEHTWNISGGGSDVPGRKTRRILVTGSCGQIGSELVGELRNRYGNESVVASDIKPEWDGESEGPFERADVLDDGRLREVIRDHGIDTIVHMAAILSAKGEREPQAAWKVNVGGLMNALEAAREMGLSQVLCPSSIAVFGKGTPRENTPQETVLKPSTMYGVTKVTGELLCDYYAEKFGVDARGLRYPGIVSAETLPGGGTTDYAVEIFYDAVEKGRYTCFLREDARLPMMYMPDCINATIQLMEAEPSGLKHHGDYNVAAMSFTPAELAEEIHRSIPDFEIDYDPDYRQKIAESWPSSIDDSAAREEWGWKPAYDLERMTEDMLERLRKRHEAGALYK
ncbi:MAG: NAD-dependent epimerase/dehydratase family protein [Candidatus Eisenbacteria bacterium]|nr:NAD-dependent epimerase/dehydratase family protein [Candidatus Eisenbacteria bacterium]